MHIERNHHTSQQEATQKLDGLIEQLMQRQFPGGVQVQDQNKSWSGNGMDFSFKLKKGFFATTISGRMVITDSLVILDCVLPTMVRAAVGEEKIREVLSQSLDQLFKA